MPESLVALERQRKAILARILDLGDFRSGSISAVSGRCGKPSCRCHQPGQPAHGPNYRLTRKVNGKTVSETFSSPAQRRKAQREVEAFHRFRELSRQLLEVNEQICRLRPVAEDAELSPQEKKRPLDHAACPTAFPVVRTRFLGNIATPRLDASPVQTVTNLWGGQLPTFDTAAAVNELFDALMGLWNALATHQSESTPFRLTRIATQAEPEDLRRLCQIRIDELEGFIDGLFGDEEAIELPERAHEALEHLREINAMLHGIVELLGRQPAPPASADDVAGTLRNVRELSRIAEQELHAVVLVCTRARQHRLATSAVTKPTIH